MHINTQWDKYYKEFLKQKNSNQYSEDKIRPIIYDRNNLDIVNINNSINSNVLSNVNNKKDFNLNYYKTEL